MATQTNSFDSATGLTLEQSEVADGQLRSAESALGVRYELSRTTGDLSPGAMSMGVNAARATVARKPGGTALLLQMSADGSTFTNTDGDNLANPGAYALDGVDDKIQVADHADLRFTSGDFSFGCWFRAPAVSQGAVLLSKRQATSPLNQYDLLVAGTYGGGPGKQISALCYETSTRYRAALTVLEWADGQWHHVIAVADRAANRMRIYVDGREADVTLYSDGIFPTISNTAPLAFGQTYDGLYKYQGDLDDVRIYNTKLTGDNAWNLYARGHDAAAANLMGHWPLDGDANDASGRGHHGTLSGGPTAISDWKQLPHSGEPLGSVDTYRWDGVDDYATPGAPAALTDLFSGGGSAAAWLTVSGLAGGGTSNVLEKAAGTATGWGLALTGLSAGQVAVRFYTTRTGGWVYWQTAAILPLRRWCHLAIAYDADSASNTPLIYIDGEAAVWSVTPTPSGDYVSDASDEFVMGNNAGLTQPLKGCLAGVALWNGLPTANDLATSFANGFDDTLDEDLLAYWPLAASGADLGPNGLTASIVGPVNVQDLYRPAARPPLEESIALSGLGLTETAHWRAILRSQATNRTPAIDSLSVLYNSAGQIRHPGSDARMAQLTGGFHG